MTSISYERIGVDYRGQKLAMFENQGEIFDYSQYPIMLSQEEKNAMDFPHILQIIAGQARSPSEMATLPQDALTPTVQDIDNLFREAMRDYAETLKTITDCDKKIVISLDQALKNRIRRQYTWEDWGWKMYNLTGAFAFVAGARYFYGGSDKRQKKENERAKIDVLREGSAHRRKWMNKIEAYETQRHKSIEEKIRIRAQIIFKELQALAQQNRFNIRGKEELAQLNTVYHVLFPNNPLTINGVNIKNYLNDLERSLSSKQQTNRNVCSPRLQDENSFLKKTAPLPFLPYSAPRPLELNELFAQIISFSIMKSEAERYLSALPEKQRLPMQHYLTTFKKLQYDKLEEMAKIALVKLVIRLTTCTKDVLVQTYSQVVISGMLKEACHVGAIWGAEFLLALPYCADLDHLSLGRVTHCFQLLNALAEDPKANTCLREFLEQEITFSQLVKSLESLYPSEFSDVINLEEDIPLLLKRFAGQDVNVSFPLPQKHLDKIAKQYEMIQDWCHQWQHHDLSQLINDACIIRTKAAKEPLQEKDILQLVAICRLAMRIKLKRYLYPTQIFAILGQLCYEKGAFAQIKTGEGKSLIITALAFVLAMQNRRVHAISSSRNLAIRDHQNTRVFFEAFGISTSHICRDQPGAHRFQAQLLFGTAFDFEFAIMQEMLYGTPLFFEKAQNSPMDHRFDCLIIDELDNLTVDTAAHNTRLSYPAEMNYEWIYTPILQFVKKRFPEAQGFFSSDNFLEDLKAVLKHHNSGEIFQKRALQIPDHQLRQWLQSAYIALFLRKEKRDYVVGNRTKKDGQTQKEIIIIDAENTGRLLHKCRWPNGVHAFVELKHGIASKTESLLPISLSHSLFYPMHRSCYGFSGTLGSTNDREAIQAVYGGNETFDVPTHRPSQRKDAPIRIHTSDEEYLTTIVETVQCCQAEGRPILILCETIQDSENIAVQLKMKDVPFELLNEIQDKSEEDILEKAGYPGVVTIATNTAGRGTDIILKENSNVNGGLHVLLTFYPKSKRVEDQARGRAGRQGQQGSSEVVLSAEKLLQRDTPVNDALAAILAHYLPQQRENKAHFMKEYHRQRVTVERSWFPLVETFFNSFQEFNNVIQDEAVLNHYAHILSEHKLLRAVTLDRNQLNYSDVRLAQEALELLTRQSLEPTKWKILLRQMAKQLKNRVITRWSVHVYQEVERLINGSSIRARISQREQLKKSLQVIEERNTNSLLPLLLHQIEENLILTQEKEFLELKNAINSLYYQQEAEWKRDLDPSGKGVILYLQDITGVDFSGI